jgi:hypothetical protein
MGVTTGGTPFTAIEQRECDTVNSPVPAGR